MKSVHVSAVIREFNGWTLGDFFSSDFLNRWDDHTHGELPFQYGTWSRKCQIVTLYRWDAQKDADDRSRSHILQCRCCAELYFLAQERCVGVTGGRQGEEFYVKMIKAIKLICWPRAMCLMLEENNPYLKVSPQSAYAGKMPHKPR